MVLVAILGASNSVLTFLAVVDCFLLSGVARVCCISGCFIVFGSRSPNNAGATTFVAKLDAMSVTLLVSFSNPDGLSLVVFVVLY